MAAFVKREGEVIRSNIEIEDLDMLESPFIQREGIKAFMGIALEAAGTVLGILYVDFREPHQFSEQEKNVVRLFAHEAAIAIHNSRLYQEAASKATALQKLHEVSPALIRTAGTPDSLSPRSHTVPKRSFLPIWLICISMCRVGTNTPSPLFWLEKDTTPRCTKIRFTQMM
jgi:hypothetical protein